MEKKCCSLFIMEILKKYSDCDHMLTQSFIREKLKTEYGLEVERQTISNTLKSLMDYYNNNTSSEYEFQRGDNNKGVYLLRRVSDAELSILVSTINNNHYMNTTEKQSLIDVLSGLGSVTFRESLPKGNGVEHARDNTIFYHFEVLYERIRQKQKVLFTYGRKGIDNKLYLENNEVKEVSPYRIVMHNNHYYLIGKHEGEMRPYRIDLIKDIDPVDERKVYEEFQPFSVFSCVEDLDKLGRLPFMSIEPWETFRFRSTKKLAIVSQVMDWFGPFVNVEDCRDGYYYTVQSTPFSMKNWALLYANDITVTTPPEFAKKFREDLKATAGRY